MTSMTLPSAPAVRAGDRPVTFLAAPVAHRTWREYGYLWLVLLLAPFALAYVLFTVSFTAGVAVTVVGLFVAGALIRGGRGWGGLYRDLARVYLGTDVQAPPPFVRRQGFWRRLGAGLGDAAGWRALLFMLLAFPTAIAGFVVSTTFLATGLGAATHWFWSRWLPLQQAADGTWHRGASFGTDYFVDTPPRQLLLAAVGVLFLLVWPWVQGLFAGLFRVLTRALLGPTQASLRVAELRDSRAGAVEDADARLRRIERDLHDGTQARLVAVAMQLGEAREQLAGGDPAIAAELVDTAHASAKEALTELREIARGIHPPALDSGLAVALETMGARAPLPVTVDVDPAVEADGRLAPAVESIAYYTVAELVTNAAKHSRASGVYVLVERHDGLLRLRVRDDGQGGAHVARDGTNRRTGLAGLVDRVRSVDGTFDLSSPVGGPTVVTVTLPTSTRP